MGRQEGPGRKRAAGGGWGGVGWGGEQKEAAGSYRSRGRQERPGRKRTSLSVFLIS